jgi:hypothetical protein
MACSAQFTIRPSQQIVIYGVMRIMTGQAVTALDRRMYDLTGQDLIFHFFVTFTANMVTAFYAELIRI